MGTAPPLFGLTNLEINIREEIDARPEFQNGPFSIPNISVVSIHYRWIAYHAPRYLFCELPTHALVVGNQWNGLAEDS
jgi:hypothetical protein